MPTMANSVKSDSTTIRMTARRRSVGTCRGRSMVSNSSGPPGGPVRRLAASHVLNNGHLARLLGLGVPDADGDLQGADAEDRRRRRDGVSRVVGAGDARDLRGRKPRARRGRGDAEGDLDVADVLELE